MKSITLPMPVFGLVVGTRAVLGVGIGLLIADRLPRDKRKTAGAVLVTIGALTTVPALLAIRQSLRRRDTQLSAGVGVSPALVPRLRRGQHAKTNSLSDFVGRDPF
jgi:hypothetical protein